jgi:hypothetical protein
MANILFVTEAYLKKYTPIGELLQWTELEPKAHAAQDSYIQGYLGTNFYNHMQTVFAAQTMSADEITLMNYIKPTLAWRIADKAYPFTHWQSKNKGVMVQNGDYAQPVDLEVIRYLREELTSEAEFYAKRLINYLCDNRDLYTQYTANNTTDMSPKSDTGYDCGLTFY